MFPNPQAALPLPPRPSLERYKKLAKELVKACKSGEETAVSDWTQEWIRTLHGLSGSSSSERSVAQAREVEDFIRRELLTGKKCTLTGAQFVLARSHGFESWLRFAKHLEALARKSSPIARFEAAADAIVSGDVAALKRCLREDPKLIHATSMREHAATLLHYVSANGVEGYRQKTPQNIVEITEVLLSAGALVDATANVYGSRCTTLGLVATSVHPEQAGVQEMLMQKLLDHGANLAQPKIAGRSQSLVIACLANGQPKAAEFLAKQGAPLDLAGAAGIGRLDVVMAYFDEAGAPKPRATRKQMESGFLWACTYGRTSVVEFLLERGVDPNLQSADGGTGLHHAAYGTCVDIVERLLERGARVDVKDKRFDARPLDTALWVWNNAPATSTRRDRGYEVVARLARAGAKFDPAQWYDAKEGRSLMLERINADSRMLAALRGEN